MTCWLLDIFVILQVFLNFVLECNYLETVWCFRVLLLGFGGTNTVLSLELIFCTTKCCEVYRVPYKSGGFQVWLADTGTIPSPLWAETLYLSSSDLRQFLHTHVLVSTQLKTCVGLQHSLSLCATLFSLMLCNSTSLLSRLSDLSAQPRESAGFYVGSPSLYHSLKTLKTVILGNHRSHLICFHPLRDHCPSLTDAQCPESSCFTQGVRQRGFENSHGPSHTLENSIQISRWGPGIIN